MSAVGFDVVVFGATSFVGQIICRHFLDTYGVNDEIKWAAAGRSQQKLAQLKADLGESAGDLTLIVADAANYEQLTAMCERTRVVLSTVGPYALYGETLIQACIATGTDYCDLTGEVQWIDEMLQKYEAKAKVADARIVHCCGFDSIPSDLGVFFVQQQAQQKYQSHCPRVKLRIKAFTGDFSGGTVASMLNISKEIPFNGELRKKLADPYLLCPADAKSQVMQPEVMSAAKDKDFASWVGPFVMAGINTRVVHRSNALMDKCWGQDFQYDEAILTGKGASGWLKAQGITWGVGGLMLATAIKPSRWLLQKFVLPEPGEGPSHEKQRAGFFDIRMYGETPHGQEIHAKVSGDRDPGYGCTARMVAEAAVCLAKETPAEDFKGGFWTPASIFGERLIKRLEASAGMKFELL